MARTNKSMSSKEADDHLSKLEKLRKDAEKQLKHINKVREGKGLPPIKRTAAESPEDIVLRTNDEGADEELVKDSEMVMDGDLITGLRVYDRSADGPVGRRVEGDEFCAIHSEVKRMRECYRELGGTMVCVGSVMGKKKDGAGNETERKAPPVLKSIMVRLMPHEAEVSGAELNRTQIDEAVDRTARAFAEATGCEVISAAVHRMSATDLHIHLQYSMVHQVEESASMLGRRLKPWKALASKLAREALVAERVKPSPAAIGKKKLDLIASGELESAPEAGVEFHKRKGLRSLGDGAILGYSFRQKLNLVRLAEEGGKLEIAAAVTRMNDGRGGFAPLAKMSDVELDAKYLDLWLERVWRRNVAAELSEDSRGRLVEAGVVLAGNYAAYGTTQVEEAHIEKMIQEHVNMTVVANAELREKQEALVAADAELREKREALAVEAERVAQAGLGIEAIRTEASAAIKERDQLKVRLTALEKSAKVAMDLVQKFRVFFAKIVVMPIVVKLLRAKPSLRVQFDDLKESLGLNK